MHEVDLRYCSDDRHVQRQSPKSPILAVHLQEETSIMTLVKKGDKEPLDAVESSIQVEKHVGQERT